MELTVIAENSVRQRGLLAEHGLCVSVRSNGYHVLFDTGQGHVLQHNAARLGIELRTVNAVAISHGHDDHTGGLAAILDLAATAPVYLHPAALEAKYVRRRNGAERIGIAPAILPWLRTRAVETAGPTEVAPGVWATGEIPRRNEIEDTGGAFFLDEACARADPLADDQALYVEAEAGLAVVIGCAHSGVVNILDRVSELTGRDRIHTVVGGMHLLRASRESLDFTAEALERYDVQVIAACHCTGGHATAFLRGRFPSRFVECTAGTRLHVE